MLSLGCIRYIHSQHTRSRVPVFLGKGDTLTVQIDHQRVFKGHVRFPKASQETHGCPPTFIF